MKRYIYTIILLLMLSFLTAGEKEDLLFNDAVNKFENKEYQPALDNFLKLENEGYKLADLYYNIGNCYYRLDNLGMSILYYKKALKVDSGHKAAKRDLEFLMSITKDKQKTEESDLISGIWYRILDSLSLNALAIIILTLFVIFIATINFTIIRFRNREKTLPIFIISIVISVMIIFVLITIIKFQHFNDDTEAVLLSQSAIGFSGPGEDFTRVFTIHEGMIMKIEKVENGWSLVKLPNGLGGWIPSSTLSRIVL